MLLDRSEPRGVGNGDTGGQSPLLVGDQNLGLISVPVSEATHFSKIIIIMFFSCFLSSCVVGSWKFNIQVFLDLRC